MYVYIYMYTYTYLTDSDPGKLGHIYSYLYLGGFGIWNSRNQDEHSKADAKSLKILEHPHTPSRTVGCGPNSGAWPAAARLAWLPGKGGMMGCVGRALGLHAFRRLLGTSAFQACKMKSSWVASLGMGA